MPFASSVGSVNDPISFDASLCSSALDSPPTAELFFDLSNGKEDGRILIPSWGTSFDITRKNGASSWKMSSSLTDYAPLAAFKEQWWRRSFEITEQGRRYILAPSKTCGSDFVVRAVEMEVELYGGKGLGEVVGELKMKCKREWKYDVKFDETVGRRLPAFCFWLVTMMNRRQFMRDVFEWQFGQAMNSSLAVLCWRRLRGQTTKKMQNSESTIPVPTTLELR
ncbi:unnamed protein product [Chondrus crispus]|uniref:Uncharacterized protein n=1 Tax=Chondrus crispus TaxID=2769 RepID=R7Q729_CHOCR|nr:unnamed protein product [Chondrus crispus]CDF34337.1 unnamed protein product [Chondrus crispus]|eukprot:XP_005714156.1 unnamed protein product [Chondrus crispus]